MFENPGGATAPLPTPMILSITRHYQHTGKLIRVTPCRCASCMRKECWMTTNSSILKWMSIHENIIKEH